MKKILKAEMIKEVRGGFIEKRNGYYCVYDDNTTDLIFITDNEVVARKYNSKINGKYNYPDYFYSNEKFYIKDSTPK